MDTQSPRFERTNSENVSISEELPLPLTFAAVDGIAFAAQRTRSASTFAPKKRFVADGLGPLVELAHLSADGLLPSLNTLPWLMLATYSDLFEGIQAEVDCWVCPSTEAMGFLKASTCQHDEVVWLKFVSAAQKATNKAGFSRKLGLQLVAAIGELIDNIELHSNRLETGWAVFRAQRGFFEFVVFDRGMGVLRSLRQSSEFASLADHGDALQVALTDGNSRYGRGSRHGNGFVPLFTGLSNLSGALRFRSGDHALLINGQNPKVIPWTKAAKPRISGLLASVCCSNRPR